MYKRQENEWCNFTWDEAMFDDAPAMLRRMKEERGLHICVWINPYIGQKSPLFKEGMKNGYLLKRPNGDVWQWDLWQAGMGLVLSLIHIYPDGRPSSGPSTHGRGWSRRRWNRRGGQQGRCRGFPSGGGSSSA